MTRNIPDGVVQYAWSLQSSLANCGSLCVVVRLNAVATECSPMPARVCVIMLSDVSVM